MKRNIVLVVAIVIAAWLASDLFARGGRGGGGFGGGGGARMGGGGGARVGGGGGGGARYGGGGGARYSGGGNLAGRTPSMSRPASRPSYNVPSGGRQSMGRLPTPSTRPSVGGGTRPNTNIGNINRPGGGPTRPGNAGSIANRPGGAAGARPGGRPTQSDLNNFLDLGNRGGMSRPGAGGGGRPSTGAIAGGAIAGGAAAEFLRDRPASGATRPGEGGAGIQRPTTRPGEGGGIQRPTTRPGEGGGGVQRPTTRPGEGGGGVQRPTTRPGEGGGGIERPTTLPGQGGGGIQRPTRPGEGGGGIQRPDRPDGGLRPDRPDGGLRPDRPNRPGEGGSGTQWRPGDWAHHRPDRIPDRNRWNNWRNDNRTNIWNNWNNHWSNHNWHDHDWWSHDWWDHHHWHYPYYPNFNFWGWAAWPGVMGWVDYGWQQPIYYNYGDNVYYQDDQVYYGDQPVASAADYAQQALTIALNQPQTAPPADDWMPLGVFAITNDGESNGENPTLFLQLAVSKQGVLSGTLQNTSNDSAQEIEGMVDKETQRAAWVPKGKKAPIMETGMPNLTQDTTPALVHFADGSTQQWLMVRLDKPKDEAATQTK